MSTVTVVWIALCLGVGFGSYLFPKGARCLALGMAIASLGYGLFSLTMPTPSTWQLLDHFGVTLMVDALSGCFIVLNALVTAAVVIYCWGSDKSAFFYAQLIILHGSVNAVFVGADLMSLYVALEVISVAVFLLIAYPRSDRSIWIGLRYLFVSNTAMLFYLLGAVLVYQANHSFAYSGLGNAPTEAIALIFLGLFTKGGIFISGLWLPLTHAEAETPVSALLSGVVINTGIFPLVRCALLVDEIVPIVSLLGVATALLGVGIAIMAQDTKRMLAASTLSQLGFVLAAPVAAGFYALTHGLAKAMLFLVAGNLPSRQFSQLAKIPISPLLWAVLTVASLSIAGAPPLAGFGAKALTLKALAPGQAIAMNGAAVGTAIALAKFVCLSPRVTSETSEATDATPLKSGLWPAIGVLLAGLMVASLVYPSTYSVSNLLKALLTLGMGGILFLWVGSKITITLPQDAEHLQHLIGTMSLVLLLLLWVLPGGIGLGGGLS